jgi:hypothetical protein
MVGDFVITSHLDSFDNLQLGLNDAGFSSAVGAFSGQLHKIDLSKDQSIDLIHKALSTLNRSDR